MQSNNNIIHGPNGLPSDFSKSPQQLADEINAAIGPNATPEQAQAAVDKVNAGARAAAQIVAGVDPELPQENEEDPLERFVAHFYSLLTPELRVILGSGIAIRAELSLADSKDGTLKIDIHPSRVVQRIDAEAKRVILAAGPDGQPVDPDVSGEKSSSEQGC
jgi:hypothetical protein